MHEPFQEAVDAFAALGIYAEIERSESGQLQLTLPGESVDTWVDPEGKAWLIVALDEGTGTT